MNFESARVSCAGSTKRIGKFKSGFTADECAAAEPTPKPKVAKKSSWVDKNISVMCRNISKKRTRFAIISLESEQSANYDEIHAESSQGTLIELSEDSRDRSPLSNRV